jgi:hypothetical protein
MHTGDPRQNIPVLIHVESIIFPAGASVVDRVVQASARNFVYLVSDLVVCEISSYVSINCRLPRAEITQKRRGRKDGDKKPRRHKAENVSTIELRHSQIRIHMQANSINCRHRLTLFSSKLNFWSLSAVFLNETSLAASLANCSWYLFFWYTIPRVPRRFCVQKNMPYWLDVSFHA